LRTDIQIGGLGERNEEMSEPTHEIGKVVELKSGGPSMTVRAICETPAGFVYEASWFVEEELRRAQFTEGEIE
jgi:uncharacterized protein YodC (DUF2158 family)